MKTEIKNKLDTYPLFKYPDIYDLINDLKRDVLSCPDLTKDQKYFIDILFDLESKLLQGEAAMSVAEIIIGEQN